MTALAAALAPGRGVAGVEVDGMSEHSAESDVTEWAVTQVESHPVRNVQTGAVTGYMLPASEWRRIRAALRARPIPPEGTVEHDERCCMNGVPATAGPHPNCPGVRALQTRPIPPEGTAR